jgi:hypothetical protein
VDSYPLSSQAQTPVEVELGCDNMCKYRLCMCVFVIAVSEQDIPGIEPGLIGRHTSALTNELQEVRQHICVNILIQKDIRIPTKNNLDNPK